MTKGEFEEVLKSEKPVLVKFFLENGCKFCDIYKPMFDAFAENHPEIKCVQIGKADLKTQAGELELKYGVTAFPATISFVDGELVKKESGVLDEAKLLNMTKTLQNITDEELMSNKFNNGIELATQERNLFLIKSNLIKIEQEISRRQAMYIATQPPKSEYFAGDPNKHYAGEMPPEDPNLESECAGCA